MSSDATAPFYLKLEVFASASSPPDAVRHLCKIADRLGLTVETRISGITVQAYPGTKGDWMAERFEEAQRRGVKWMSPTVLPGGSNEEPPQPSTR